MLLPEAAVILPWRGRRRVAGLAAELEDQNVINEGYLSSAECNALVVSACRALLQKVTRLVRSPAGAADHMVTRFFFHRNRRPLELANSTDSRSRRLARVTFDISEGFKLLYQGPRTMTGSALFKCLHPHAKVSH